MKATSAPLDGNKVRLTVEVDEPEVERVLAEAVRTIGRQLRVPGFRPGRVPRQVLEARVGGAAALRAEALREAIPEFYSRALSDTQVDPIAPPEVDITSGAESGSFSFDAIVAVRPVVAIPGYAGLSVTVPRVEVSDEEVDAQLDRMRETEAELVDVERPAADHDVVTIDLQPISAPEGEPGPDAGGLVDFSYEVGSDCARPGPPGQGCETR
jgi:trigger factor